MIPTTVWVNNLVGELKNTSTAGADEIVIYFTWMSSKYLLGFSEPNSIIKNKEQSKKVTKV